MENYLQQLDKIDHYLDFTDVNAFPIWRFIGEHPWVTIGLMAFAVFGYIVAEEMDYRWLEITTTVVSIGLVIGMFGALIELGTPEHDIAGVTKNSYAQATNYVADMSEDELTKLYEDTNKYEFTESQQKQYAASRRIVRKYYEKTHKQ